MGSDNFSLSKPGYLCENPVNTLEGCKRVASIWPNVNYVIGKGAGHDLPYGCILDNITSLLAIVYWNPNGLATSADPNIRQICKLGVELHKGA